MAEFKIDDIVKYSFDGIPGYGIVTKVTSKKISVYDFDDEDTVTILKNQAAVLPPIMLNKGEYQKLARYELTLTDIAEDNIFYNIQNADNYQITLEDLLCVLKKIQKENIDPDTFYEEWYDYFADILESTEYEETDNIFYNRNTVLEEIIFAFYILDTYENNPMLKELTAEVETYLKDESKPLSERNFPVGAKLSLLHMLNNNDALNAADEETARLYKKFAQELYKKDEILALDAVGYGSYGGNRVFECDWKKSEECMLKLFDMVDTLPDKAFYANTLGYIYYYGRCNGGVPEYEKAYKYFSFAAFNGVYEAEYKIADMFQNGYGVAKCKETAENIILRLYDENLKYFQQGNFTGKFADIAFRMGNFYKDNEDEPLYENALYYYYQASFAIRARMAEANLYGDASVAKNIQDKLDEVKEALCFEPQKKIKCYNISYIFAPCLSSGEILDITPKKISENKYKLTIRLHQKFNSNNKRRLFLTVPELDMCGLYDSLTITVTGSKFNHLDEKFSVDEMNGDAFYYDGFPVFFCDNCIFEVSAPKNSNKKHRFISVKFTPNGGSYDYLCDNENIKIGDKIIVPANDEEKEVTVVNIFEKTESETALPIKSYKKV